MLKRTSNPWLPVGGIMVATLVVAMTMASGSFAKPGEIWQCKDALGNTVFSESRLNARCTRRTDLEAAPMPARRVAPPPSGTSSAGASLPLPTLANDGPLPDLPAAMGALTNFGEPNLARLQAAVRSRRGLHYVQLGDSHTAGDYLTDRLRARWQVALGNGGIGWATPLAAPGQRNARLTITSSGWRLVSSRRESQRGDYPAGGFIALPAPGASIDLLPKRVETEQQIAVLIRQSAGDAPLSLIDASGVSQPLASPVQDGQWHVGSARVRLPARIMVGDSPNTALGGWWFIGGQGAVVSALGINGSELAQRSRWRAGWLDDLEPAKPDLIALAYGTNEAFRDTLDPNAVQADASAALAMLRRRFPAAVLLVIGPPEALTATAGSCGRRAAGLDAVRVAFEQAARTQRALFWDWQKAMGGPCSMKRWMGSGLARTDGVHFSKDGYGRIGDLLYQDLNAILSN